jgi:hypothetical protein
VARRARRWEGSCVSNPDSRNLDPDPGLAGSAGPNLDLDPRLNPNPNPDPIFLKLKLENTFFRTFGSKDARPFVFKKEVQTWRNRARQRTLQSMKFLNFPFFGAILACVDPRMRFH